MDNNTNTLHSPRTQGGMTDMTVGSPARGILRFAVPLVLGYILQQMYQVIDAVIVGRWIGVGALAAVGASSSIMFLIMGFCNGSCAGFAIPVAQAFGAKDFAKMRSYVSNAMRIGVVLAVVITLLSCAFCSKILHLVNTPSDIFDDAWTFLFLQFLAIPFTIAYNLQASLIRALGDSKHPFYFLIFSSLFNIALDAVLIFGLGMGVLGAGVATLLAQAFSSALCYGFIRRRMTVLIPQGDERAYDNKRISILLNNGVPMGLQFSITAVGVIICRAPTTPLAPFTWRRSPPPCASSISSPACLRTSAWPWPPIADRTSGPARSTVCGVACSTPCASCWCILSSRSFSSIPSPTR